MRSHISPFTEHLKARQLAPGTITPYVSELNRFADFLAEDGTALDSLSISQATRYLAREGRSSVTTRRALTVLCQFFFWLKHPLAEELGGIRLPRTYQATPNYLTEDEEKALRKALKARTDIRDQPRDRALFCLLLDTGVRIAEAAGLCVGDVDLGEKTIRLMAKGGKNRTRFLPAETRDLLKPLIAGHSAETAVFRTRTGHGVSDRHMRRLLDAWTKVAGIARPVHPHALRHTFATSLLKKTGNLRLVQLALDHENPKTTAIYAHVTDKELRSAIENRRG